MTGPRLLSFKDIVGEIAHATGRNIQYEPVSLEQYNGMMKAAGLPEDYIWLFDYLFREVLGNPDNHVVSHDVEDVLRRKAIDFSTYAKEMASSGIWNQNIPQTL